MIITVTCNPAIDKSISGDITTFNAGGKGINVSKVLKVLNTDSIATGFIGKNNKNIILDELDKLNIKHHFIEIDGDVRTNTKRIIDNKLYEENQKGPELSSEDIIKLKEYLNTFHNDIVCISGSCTSNIYYDLITTLKRNNNYVILDCDKQLFADGIKAKPNCIKPNDEEICRFLNCEYNEEFIINEIKKLGIDFVCLSLGNNGAIFIENNNVYKVNALDINYVNSLGAGDSMVAAMAYSKLNNLSIIDTISYAMACAGSMCETNGSSSPSLDNILSKLDKVKIVF